MEEKILLHYKFNMFLSYLMKKIKYFMITGMLLASIGLAGCGKKSEDDITNKEIYQDDLEPLTEEELKEQGIYPNTIRLSIGTENIDDIIEDLDEAFKAVAE